MSSFRKALLWTAVPVLALNLSAAGMMTLVPVPSRFMSLALAVMALGDGAIVIMAFIIAVVRKSRGAAGIAAGAGLGFIALWLGCLPSYVRISDLTISPSAVGMGQEVAVSFTAANSGSAGLTDNVSVILDGRTAVTSQMVTVPGGATQRVIITFTMPVTSYGKHEVRVDSQKYGYSPWKGAVWVIRPSNWVDRSLMFIASSWAIVFWPDIAICLAAIVVRISRRHPVVTRIATGVVIGSVALGLVLLAIRLTYPEYF